MQVSAQPQKIAIACKCMVMNADAVFLHKSCNIWSMFSQEEQQAKFKEEKIRIAMEKLREARIKKVILSCNALYI
jgi:hypothetical protein